MDKAAKYVLLKKNSIYEDLLNVPIFKTSYERTYAYKVISFVCSTHYMQKARGN